MTRAALRALSFAFAVSALALLAAAEPSFADTSRVGRNLGQEVASWGRNLLLGVAALVGIPVLLRRDFSEGLRLVVLVVLVGAFVFATPAVRQVIGDLWRSLAF
jgi:cobalamin synthase